MNRKVRFLRLADPGRLAVYLLALWKLLRHRDTPRAARWLAYSLSPIDLIPDFIPVLGLLDDLVLVPFGVALVVRLTPKPLWEGLLREAEASKDRLPHWRWGALLVLIVWAALLGLAIWGLVVFVGA